MKIFRYLVIFLAGLLVLFLLFLSIATIADYKPDPIEEIYNGGDVGLRSDTTFSVTIWNIGYGGLDAAMDFFYDGGKQVRPDRKQLSSNIAGIVQELERYRKSDFILLQETDRNSKRSYGSDIHDQVTATFPEMHSAFATNYRSFFVPLPLKAPMGRVESGLQTLSAYTPETVTRHQFPGNYAWPTRMFMLDRCFMVNRYPMANGHDMLIVNTHNSAYDDGSLRTQQMEFMKAFLLEEYNKGNYIIVGGDWNQTPYGFLPAFSADVFDTNDLTYVPEGYPEPGWKWAYDASVPTNRRLRTSYVKGVTPVTVIDFFLLSPNVEPLLVKGIDLHFTYSDHHPVQLKFKLNP